MDKQAQGFTWLHLTDLHSGGRLDDTYWPTVKAQLWQDLHNPPVEELRAPDIVFFTGDLSFSGQKNQFDDVARFLDELRHKIGAVPIVAVPGNHDLARPQETERARFLWLRFLADAFCEPEQARLWAERSPLRNALTDLFEPYTAFAQRSIIEPLQQLNATVVQGVLPGDLSVSLSIRDLRLGIVGLNSTWRQFAGGDFERWVTVHPRQLHAVLHNDLDAFRQQHHIHLLLQHHPPEWLENQHEWEGIIEPNFDLILLGHLHAHDATSVQQNAQDFRRRVQARSLFGIEHYGEGAREDRRFGYSLGHAYLAGDTMQPHVWARTLLERPTWHFGHPADVGYREREGQRLAPFSVPRDLRTSRSARLQRQEPAITWTILLHDLLTPIDIRKAQEALTPDIAEGHVIRMQWRDGEDRWSATAREQESMIAALTQDNAKRSARLAVFSLSPIPLTIHLGYCLSSKMEVTTFQYHNHHDRHSWRWPEHPANVDTALTTSGLPSARIPEPCEGVIRISLSARIHPEETEAIVPRARFSIDLEVSTPATTWLIAPSQVEAVRRTFRDALGQLRSLVPQCERLHLFYAGPPPGAIVIGQEMNPRMNPRIVLYEYARSATPRYRAVLTIPTSLVRLSNMHFLDLSLLT